jgi:hypothetical protein
MSMSRTLRTRVVQGSKKLPTWGQALSAPRKRARQREKAQRLRAVAFILGVSVEQLATLYALDAAARRTPNRVVTIRTHQGPYESGTSSGSYQSHSSRY